MEIDGTVIVITDIQSGTSKNGNAWQKQGFVIETTGNYPRRVYFELFGDKMSLMPALKDFVRVSFDISSSDYNGRWYTQLSAWKVAKMVASAVGTPPASQAYPTAPQPQGFTSAPPAYYGQPAAPQPSYPPQPGNDGLPF